MSKAPQKRLLRAKVAHMSNINKRIRFVKPIVHWYQWFDWCVLLRGVSSQVPIENDVITMVLVNKVRSKYKHS